MKMWLDTSQGAPPPHQTAGNIRNGNPLRLAFPRSQKGGYGKILAVDTTSANTGLFLRPFSFFLFTIRMPVNFYRPISHGANRLHMAPPTPLHRTQCPPGIFIGTLNIRYSRGFGLAQDIWTVERGFFDVMVLTKTKIQSEAYSHNHLGYDVT